jgi:hypothetical protein
MPTPEPSPEAWTGKETGKHSQQKRSSAMTQSRRERLDDNRARKWLAKHAPKLALDPKLNGNRPNDGRYEG